MTRAERVEQRMLTDIPPHRHDEARAAIHKTFTYQHAAAADALANLGHELLKALHLRSDR